MIPETPSETYPRTAMKTAQDRSGRFDLHESPNGSRRGPSWLTVQILAALCGLLLVASILLPIAMGVRMRNASRETNELAEQLTTEIERSATLERDNRELRMSGGRPELVTELAALREERDRLKEAIDESGDAGPAARPGPDPTTSPVDPPLRQLVEDAGSIQLVTRLNDAASKLGVAAGPVGFSAQQRLNTILPSVQIVPAAATRLVIDVVAIPYGGGSADQGGIVVITVSLTQNWRLDDQRVVKVTLWSSSTANNTTAAQSVKDAEILTSTLLDRFAEAVKAP
jgi:hypothetical protein